MAGINLKTFLEYKYISNLKYSKENNLLAFVVQEANIDDNKYDSYIYTYDLANNEIKKMTTQGVVNAFEFFEDSILFKASRTKEEKDLEEKGLRFSNYYKLSLKGGEAEKFATIPLDVLDYKVLDEENWILLGKTNISGPNLEDISKLEGEERKEAIAKAAEEIKSEKDFERIDQIPFWSNGGGFVSGDKYGIYKYNLKTQELSKLTDDKKQIIFYELVDNKIYVIYYDFTGKLEMENSIGIIDLKTGDFSHILSKDSHKFFYVNELDGDIITCGVDMNIIGVNTNPSFYLIKNGDLVKISHDFDRSVCSSVNSDSRLGGNECYEKVHDRMYFTVLDGFNTHLYSISKTGDLKVEIDLPGSIDGFKVGDGEIYTVSFRGNNLQEIYKFKDGKEEKLTNFNDNILENYEISTPEHIVLNNRDVELDGFIIRPIGFEEGKKYKTILEIHGGPKTSYGTIFNSEMQYLASLGYVVIYTNPRGSDGKGNEFSDIRGKYGSIDYEDLMFFTKEMVKRYDFIDEGNIGLTGGSYGGYMTNWIVGHTNYFKAAVTQRSISNWFSKFALTDIGYYFVHDQVGVTIWEDPEKIWENSPLKYADQVKTPTFIIHSEEDYRCDVGQGYQFFTALKYHGVDTEMLVLKGENHDLSRSGRPKQRTERLKAISSWFERKL